MPDHSRPIGTLPDRERLPSAIATFGARIASIARAAFAPRIALAATLAALLATPSHGGSLATPDTSREAFSQPVPGLTDTERQTFQRGRALFRQPWVVAPARDNTVDGLGPLYNRLSCIACHPKDGRGQAPDGPGERMQSMLVRLSVPGRDAHGGPKPHPAYGGQLNEEGIPGVPGEGRAEVSWEESTVTLADGEVVKLRKPRIELKELAYGPADGILMSPRVGPQVYGMGLLDAVSDAELARLARIPRPDGVKGRVNKVWDAERQRSVAGRFGLKANMPTLRQQIAGAMLGDLGITSPIFREQNCSAAQTACKQAPDGGKPELTSGQLRELAFYLAHIAPPARRDTADPLVRRGEAAFTRAGCTACHLPELQTARKAEFPRLAGQRFHAYTDLLVHDMGAGLADDRPDYRAGGRDWRTPPLWGIGLVGKVNEHTRFLHDGRARSFAEAILWHGGEGRAARDRYASMTKAEREALQAFLGSL